MLARRDRGGCWNGTGGGPSALETLAKSWHRRRGYFGILHRSINATHHCGAGADGAPYLLPLGPLSGFSSLVPYAGPIFTGAFITLSRWPPAEQSRR
jgi:hypothetical protein